MTKTSRRLQATSQIFNQAQDRLKLHFRRFEFKYLISVRLADLIKDYISKRLELDQFAKKSGSYIVQSIYLDTIHYSSYQDVKAGVKNRVKYRLRSYNPDQKNSKYVFWEIKRKLDVTVFKDRALLTNGQSQKYIDKNIIPPPKQEVLRNLQQARLRYLLRPNILIRYRRQPFINKTTDLRITFDQEIEANKIDPQWKPASWSRSIHPQSIIMEIKFTGSLPFWLAEIVRKYNLERKPFSKYALSLEKVNPKLYG